MLSLPKNLAFGQRVKEIRKKSGRSQEKFGQLFDPPAPKSVVSRWEHGGTPNSNRLLQLANIGQVSTDFLLYGLQLEEKTAIVTNIVSKWYAKNTFFSFQPYKYADVETFNVTTIVDRYLLTHGLAPQPLEGKPALNVGFITKNEKPLPTLTSFLRKHLPPLRDDKKFILRLDHEEAFTRTPDGLQGNENTILPIFCYEMKEYNIVVDLMDGGDEGFEAFIQLEDIVDDSLSKIDQYAYHNQKSKIKQELDHLIEELKKIRNSL